MSARTISDIAKLAQVSGTTVSRYLNGRYEYMSEKTRERIRKIIEEENFVVNSFAQGLRSQKSNTIAILIALATQTSTAFLQGICSECYKNGFTTRIYDSYGDIEIEKQLLKQCASDRVAGVVLYPANIDFRGYEQLFIESKIPLVMVNRYLPTWSYDAAYVDHYKLTMTGLERMWDRGYHDIMLITDDLSVISSKYNRCKAFMDFSGKHGCSNLDSLMAKHGPSFSDLEEKMSVFIRKTQGRKRAFFTVSLPTMKAVIDLMEKFGLKNDEQNGICTYDSRGYSQLIGQNIMALVQPIEQLGKEATSILLKRIRGELPEEPCVKMLEGEIVGPKVK